MIMFRLRFIAVAMNLTCFAGLLATTSIATTSTSTTGQAAGQQATVDTGQSPSTSSPAAANHTFDPLAAAYQSNILPLLQQFCTDCHSTDQMQGELDLQRFKTLQHIRQDPAVWQHVAEMLDNGEMPPPDSAQPDVKQRAQIKEWVQRYLKAEALASAGDPGPVVLRRLNNAEYTYTIQDLTGIPLQPAREFPTDSASGEGFTNTGSSLVMSPAMITKYLDAARKIGSHAVLLPDGFRFSAFNTRRDFTNEMLEKIRNFYARYTDTSAGDQVNLQGIVFKTNGGGRLPLEKYLTTLQKHRAALRTGSVTFDQLAKDSAGNTPQLSARYLQLLWTTLESEQRPSSLLVQHLQSVWQSAAPDDISPLLQHISQWQSALWKFTTVGHIGKVNGPKAWLEPVSPVTSRQELRLPLSPLAEAARQQASNPSALPEVTLYLVAGDAGTASANDIVVWERPRLVAPGRPDLLLKDVRDVTRELSIHRQQIFSNAAKCLAAAAKAAESTDETNVAALAAEFNVPAASLSAWLDYMGIGSAGPVKLGTPIGRRMESGAGYDFIQGWVEDDALSIVANSSDQHVRIPGNMNPHSIAVHPAPTLSAVVGWNSPVAGTLNISGQVQHAHPECGNGTAWTVELRRGNTRQRLATGISHGATVVPFGPLPGIAVRPGDVICLSISPRDGNHSCDLTSIDMTLDALLADGRVQRWNLAEDLSPDLLAGNPHADQHGNTDVWYFFSEPASGTTGHIIPAGSLLAKWQSEADTHERAAIATELQKLLQQGPKDLPADSPDGTLYQQLTAFSGPLMSSAMQTIASRADTASQPAQSADNSPAWGLNRNAFGRFPQPEILPALNSQAPTAQAPHQDVTLPNVESASLCVAAPAVIEIRLPADLVAGTEFVTTATLHPAGAAEGSVQMQILTSLPEQLTGLQPTSLTNTNGPGPWTSNNRGVAYSTPIIVAEKSIARQQVEQAFHDFRQLFPSALCYTKIVPVDEVVTLTLYYREDDQLQRLLLTEQETTELNRLWDEMHYISRDALASVDAFEQLMEFATQDADPSVFAPMGEPIRTAAAEFRQTLKNSEAAHIKALIDFAAQAYRRELHPGEADKLRNLYAQLRSDELSHEEAFGMLLQRILVSPAFLYRLETPADGPESSPVSDWELASRLSYFLWSSAPDTQLRSAAANGSLSQPDVLKAHAARMLQDPKSRRLAAECFCQWLHIYDFDQLDEKSEQHFPTFNAIKPLLYEEAIRTFTHLLQNDGSVLELFDADHTFLNATLAKHYGIPNVQGDNWRKVNGVGKYARGGIFGLGATLAKQSGASRTSPILRGNWLSEVVLGEKLPKPPKGVPPLPEQDDQQQLTVRQLVERHTSDKRCSGCHLRIDPYGYALEGFDAIGRLRTTDSGGRPIETATTVFDGTSLQGFHDLKQYLLHQRRDAIIHQFCKKLLGYALGREVRLSDEPLLSDMQQQLEDNHYRISIAVNAIVTSRQFREIRGKAP